MFLIDEKYKVPCKVEFFDMFSHFLNSFVMINVLNIKLDAKVLFLNSYYCSVILIKGTHGCVCIIC